MKKADGLLTRDRTRAWTNSQVIYYLKDRIRHEDISFEEEDALDRCIKAIQLLPKGTKYRRTVADPE